MDTGNILIKGGNITATGGDKGGAGIGGSQGHGGGTIAISGGSVTAYGGGGDARGGGIVEVRGGYQGADIGTGGYGASGTFSTGPEGNAVIFANTISDTTSLHEWRGISGYMTKRQKTVFRLAF